MLLSLLLRTSVALFACGSSSTLPRRCAYSRRGATLTGVNIQRVAISAEVKALIAASELPIDDLDDPTIVLFAASDAARIVGVVVEPAYRTGGLGAQGSRA